MLLIGIANLGLFLAASAYGGAVPLLAFGVVPVELNQHGVIDLRAEPIGYRRKVALEPVCGQLDPISKTACKVLNELSGATGVTFANQPRANQFGVGVDSDPGPRATDAELIQIGTASCREKA